MARIEAKLAALGLVLPKPLQAPPGVVLPFSMVRIVGRRAIVSGHGPLNADGTLAQPLGKVGSDLSIEQGYAARSSPVWRSSPACSGRSATSTASPPGPGSSAW